MDNMNFWTIDINELPSKGLYYNKDFEIQVRPLNVEEVKYLATLNDDNASIICNNIIQRCVKLKNLKYNDIVLADREYIAFWIRCNSFTQSSGYTINIPHCRSCNNEINHEIKLENFKTDFIKNNIKDIFLPDINANIPLKQPKVSDSNEICNIIDADNVIVEYATYLDTNNSIDEKYRFIIQLTAYDFSILKEAIESIKCGMHTEFNIECPICHMFNPVKLILNDKSLFGATKLTDILTTITHISKYTNLQITNDWPWVEVELEQKIVNDMIEQENKETQKQMSKANAQSAAAKSKANMSSNTSRTSIPNYHTPSTYHSYRH